MAVKVSFAPERVKETSVLSNTSPVTLISEGGFVLSTFTVQVAVFCPSSVVAVITAVPLETEVTSPAEFTTATAGLLLLQVIFLFVALLGVTLAFIYSVAGI